MIVSISCGVSRSTSSMAVYGCFVFWYSVDAAAGHSSDSIGAGYWLVVIVWCNSFSSSLFLRALSRIGVLWYIKCVPSILFGNPSVRVVFITSCICFETMVMRSELPSLVPGLWKFRAFVFDGSDDINRQVSFIQVVGGFTCIIVGVWFPF